MPKYYEPLDFEEKYSCFLWRMLDEKETKKGESSYIDPDNGGNDFYYDLACFLNGREREEELRKKREEEIRKKLKEDLTEERKKELKKELENGYFFLPPSKAPKTKEMLKKCEKLRTLEGLMDEKKIIVVKKNNNYEESFLLTSDQFGFSAREDIYIEKKKEYPLVNLLYSDMKDKVDKKEKTIKRITEYVKNTRTIGGSFLWQMTPKRKCPYNASRGVGSWIEDRVDLTLEDIKRTYYNYDHDDKKPVFKKDFMEKWLKHFVSFKIFVEYFMLEPFCEKVMTDSGNYDYVPINIIDGKPIDEDNIEKYSQSGRKNYHVRNLEKEDILNMLDRLEGMILIRTANMERAINGNSDQTI